MGKIKGDNSLGFRNEEKIAHYLDGKHISELNDHWRQIVCFMFNVEDDYEGQLSAHTIPKKNKPDIFVELCGKNRKTISIKEGSGNSVHQESIQTFMEFLEEYHLSDDVKKYIYYFLYKDGTTNNTGEIRLNAKDFYKQHPEIIQELHTVFNSSPLKKDLVERFLFTGKDKTATPADFLYHGTVENGFIASREEVIDKLLNIEEESNGAIKISCLTLQTWNANLERKEPYENRRHVLQIKFGSCKKILQEIRNGK